MLNKSSAQSLLSKKLLSFAAVTSLTSLSLTVSVHLPAAAASLIPVNTELSLLIDVSGSVNRSEYALQIGGYRNAFLKLAPEFESGKFGSVAVNLIQWSGETQQQQSISWTLLKDQASVTQFAAAIGGVVRASSGNTAPGSAIQFATPLFRSNNYDGQRWVIDVSGDGVQNSGFSTIMARNNALAAGVSTINGLPIVTSADPTLETWYKNNIQGGVNSFVIPANGFDDFDRAIEQKLRLELTLPPTIPTPVPVPGSLLAIALAGGGLSYLKRRRSV